MGSANIGDTTFTRAHGAQWKDKIAYYMTTVVGCDDNNLCKLLCITVAEDHVEPKIIDLFVDEEARKDDLEAEYRSAIESLTGKVIDGIIVDALLMLREQYASENRPSSEQDAQDRQTIETELKRRGVSSANDTQSTAEAASS